MTDSLLARHTPARRPVAPCRRRDRRKHPSIHHRPLALGFA